MADATGTTVWRWDQAEPFGSDPADENPSGLGTFDLPLRLPGEYFDKETNLHYNYFRDYDPSTGRYGESDPVGLHGGLNTYGYGRADPLHYVDPTGEISLVAGVALVGVVIVGGIIYSHQQQGAGGGRKSDDPLSDPSGASSSASSISTRHGSPPMLRAMGSGGTIRKQRARPESIGTWRIRSTATTPRSVLRPGNEPSLQLLPGLRPKSWKIRAIRSNRVTRWHQRLPTSRAVH